MTPWLPLRPGSLVRVIAPSGVVPEEAFEAGRRVLEGWGLRVHVSPRLWDRRHYLAGPDEARLREWHEAFGESDVEAVVAARGGYGALRILPGAASAPQVALGSRVLMGFSDITALHVVRLRQGLPGLHGPNVTTLGGLDPESLRKTRCALFGEDWQRTFRWEGLRAVRRGQAEGRLVPGNLTLLCALLGTRFAPPLRDCIWVVEDTHEPAYRLDRLLTQISLAPGISGLRGLVLGDLGLDEADTAGREALREVLTGLAERLRRPVLEGFPMGHRGPLHPLPVGARARIDASAGTLEVLEDPYLRPGREGASPGPPVGAGRRPRRAPGGEPR